MRLVPITALIATLWVNPVRAGDPIVLDLPAGSTKADADKCATALGRRFAAVGLKSLKAVVVEKDGTTMVEVTSKADIAPETQARIALLARIPGQRGMFKAGRDLTADEKASGFTSGKSSDPNSAKAPPGTSWVWCIGRDLAPLPQAEATAWLVREVPSVTWSEISVAERGKDEWTFRLAAAATRRLILDLTGGKQGVILVDIFYILTFDSTALVDDVLVVLGEGRKVLKEGTFSLPATLAENLEAILRYPMPLALKAVELKK
ncbi:MAG: hypothetical protein HYY18_10950 [Planctomycetes bacterium]|nr:hypothetical protein [Planctomycetota bacterium]